MVSGHPKRFRFPRRRDLPVSIFPPDLNSAFFLSVCLLGLDASDVPVGAPSLSRCGSCQDKDVPPTGRHQAHLCSSSSPDLERVRIAWQICQSFRRSGPTGVLRFDSQTHGEGQVLALREEAAFFFIVARGPVTATLSDL